MDHRESKRHVNPTGLTNTTTALLEGLHEPGNRSAWNEFDRRYRPILVAFLRRMGLDDSDAGDVAQETLTCFVQDYRDKKYDRAQGRLRSWLVGIARCRLADMQRTKRRRREMRGESAIANIPNDTEADRIWEMEEQRHIFELAVGDLRTAGKFNVRTIDAFERVVLRHEPVESVSAQTGLSPQEIYNAKNRVVQRLREIVKRYEVNYV